MAIQNSDEDFAGPRRDGARTKPDGTATVVLSGGQELSRVSYDFRTPANAKARWLV